MAKITTRYPFIAVINFLVMLVQPTSFLELWDQGLRTQKKTLKVDDFQGKI
jgi:hypothetical protein